MSEGHPIGRTRRALILGDLAGCPEGRSTPQLAALLWPGVQPWQQALTKAGNLMRIQERHGRVIRAGIVPSGSQQTAATVWRLTDAGAEHLFYLCLDRLRDARGIEAVRERGAELQRAADACTRFYVASRQRSDFLAVAATS